MKNKIKMLILALLEGVLLQFYYDGYTNISHKITILRIRRREGLLLLPLIDSLSSF